MMKYSQDPELKSFAEHGLRFRRLAVAEGYVSSGDARIFYAVFGSGRPVLLLHGGMGNGSNWANQVSAIVDSGRQAIVMDTRGHGRSGAGSKPYSYRLFAQDALGLLDCLGLEQAILLGWSDGACSALELARTNPGRVLGVVFFACNVDPTGTREFVMTRTIGNCLTRHERDFERLTPGLEAFGQLQPKLEPMQKNEPNYSREQLRAIRVPVAVIQGEHDEFIRLEHAQYLADALPDAWFGLMKGVGHFAPIQDPPLFNGLMLDSIAKIESGQRDRT